MDSVDRGEIPCAAHQVRVRVGANRASLYHRVRLRCKLQRFEWEQGVVNRVGREPNALLQTTKPLGPQPLPQAPPQSPLLTWQIEHQDTPFPIPTSLPPFDRIDTAHRRESAFQGDWYGAARGGCKRKKIPTIRHREEAPIADGFDWPNCLVC